jgi:uroporphyrin-III C-methyltransferase
MPLLPIFLKLDGRPGLLVGAGNVALEKLNTLLSVGLRLRVVAPEGRPEIRTLAANGTLQWIQRPFELSDLDGSFVVIAATDNPAVNSAVYRGAVERGILCNSVDDIPNCDFFFGSVVSRGNLQIAISTAGESPAVAQRLRREIDAQLPNDLGPWLENVGKLRREVLAIHPRGEARKLLLHELAQRQICDSPTCSTRQLARAPLTPAASDEPQKADVIQSEARSGPHVSGVTGANDLLLRNPASQGCVYLVGAGPGAPDLLTVKALRLIQSANVILHDDLVPPAILQLAPTAAEIINVGKRCGTKTITQDEINALMVRHARAHRSVIRLKSGDPLIFGRAAEEIAALTAADVRFEVVPGITSAFAAAAAAGCSLTSRNSASNVIFSTGHHAQSHNQSPLPQLEDATRVVYMPGRDLRLLALEWLQEGLPPDFPCAIVSRAAQAGQQIHHTTLAALGDTTPTHAPSLLLAGWALKESVEARHRAADEVATKA